MLIAFVIAFFIALFPVALVRPRQFFLIYMVIITRGFGFIDLSSFEVQGVININFYLHVLICIVCLVYLAHSLRLTRESSLYLKTIALFFMFGILYPFINQYSAIQNAVIDGKDFLGYALVGYIVLRRDTLTPRFLLQTMILVGCILSTVVIVSRFFNYVPPAFSLLRPDIGASAGMHFNHITFISMPLIFLECRALMHDETLYSLIRDSRFLLLMTGLLLQGHRSVTFSTVFVMTIFFAYFLRRKRGRRYAAQMAGMAMVLLFFIVISLDIPSVINNSFLSDASISSRMAINVFRWDYFMRKPFIGYGFIDENSNLGFGLLLNAVSGYTQTLGTVDAGYLDLMLRFGLIGTAILIIVFMKVVRFVLVHKVLLNEFTMASALFILSYFPISLTLSVFSYEHGIIAASIAVAVIYGQFQLHAMPRRV